MERQQRLLKHTYTLANDIIEKRGDFFTEVTDFCIEIIQDISKYDEQRVRLAYSKIADGVEKLFMRENAYFTYSDTAAGFLSDHITSMILEIDYGVNMYSEESINREGTLRKTVYKKIESYEN